MTKYGVTGATGHLGNFAIKFLLKKNINSSDIICMGRDEKKLEELKNLGAQARFAEYEDIKTLEKAFKGIDRLFFISGSEVGKRITQHQNVIDTAKKMGIKLIVYTSIFHADTSKIPLAKEHVATEKMIKESDIKYVFLRNNWYVGNYIEPIKKAKETGYIKAAVGNGKVSPASRSDYAQAAIEVITRDNGRKNIYNLCGEPLSYSNIAEIGTEITGSTIKYKSLSAEELKQSLIDSGTPEDAAGFVVAIDISIKNGELEGSPEVLEELLGRKPQTMKEVLNPIFN